MESNEILENTPETFETLINEVNEFKDKYYRAVAETENMRKRVEKEKINAIKFANEKFARDLLETLDNFENSMKIEMPEDIKLGIELIYKNLQKTLLKHNITECDYKFFDPLYHEAISHIDSELDTNMIVEVLRKGYIIDDRLLRPAMVVVGK